MMHGQEAAPPSVDLFPEQDEVSPTPPPNGPELPELKQLDDSFKPKSLGQDADALKVHVLWRELKNRTVNDPEVQAARKYAQAARTDLEKRNRLRNYYEIYYQRMSALATTPELKLALQALKTAQQSILAQPRVRPTPGYIYAVTDTFRHAAKRRSPKTSTRRKYITSVLRRANKRVIRNSSGIRLQCTRSAVHRLTIGALCTAYDQYSVCVG